MQVLMPIGYIKNKPVYRIPVTVIVNFPDGDIEDMCNPHLGRSEIISYSARDAAALAKREMLESGIYHCDIVATGPKGGKYRLHVSITDWLHYKMTGSPDRQIGLGF